MDIGQLFARLQSQTVNYMGAGGSTPVMTPADIAGAMAFVPKGLGRAVLEAVYWPDAACRTHDLRNAVISLVMPELKRQAKQLNEAIFDVQLAHAALHWTRTNASDRQYLAIDQAQERLDLMRGKMWPRNTVERLPRMTCAIVAEIRVRAPCSASRKHGMFSDRQRAQAIGCDASDYIKRWKMVYEWLFYQLWSGCCQAANRLKSSLERDVAA